MLKSCGTAVLKQRLSWVVLNCLYIVWFSLAACVCKIGRLSINLSRLFGQVVHLFMARFISFQVGTYTHFSWDPITTTNFI
jgi:hypothetical protein